MNTEQLRKIVSIANGKGYRKFLAEDIGVYIEKAMIIAPQDDTFRAIHINEIIFCPEFGKAYWGENLICSNCEKRVKMYRGTNFRFRCNVCMTFDIARDEDDVVGRFIPSYQYHQSKLGGLSDTDRQEYLVKDLENRKEK